MSNLKPNNKELKRIRKALLNLNPLQSLEYHVVTEASMPFCYSDLTETKFWAIRRNCRYKIISGMFPDLDLANSINVREHNFCLFANKMRKTALVNIISILRVDKNHFELMKLDEHITGNTVIAISDIWHILIQSDLDSFEVEGVIFSQLIINYMVMLR